MDRPAASSPFLPRSDWWWIFDPRVSLRARVALLVGGTALAFTFLLGNVTGRLCRRSLEASTGMMFEALAAQMSDKLDRTLYERYRTLHLAADLPVLRTPESTAADRRRLIESVQIASPDFAWIGWADAQGRIVASTHRLFEGADASRRPWFLGAREFPHVGGLHEMPELTRALPAAEDGVSPTRFLDLAVPVLDADGRFAGVLAAHLHWKWTQGVQASVVPESALRDRIGVTVYGATGDVLLDSGVSGWTQPPDPPALGEGRRHRGHLAEATTGGSNYLSGYMYSRGFRDYRGLNWLTVVRQPAERVFAGVVSLERSILLWGGSLAVAGAVLGWLAAGRHARRLRAMAAAAHRIRTGDVLAVLPGPRGEGEIDLMSGALGELVEDLRAQRETLIRENTRLAGERPPQRVDPP